MLHVTGHETEIVTRSKVSERVQKYRAGLRAAGLRPIQIWVPDVRSKSFAAQARRQSLAVAGSRHAAEDQAFIDSISDWRP